MSKGGLGGTCRHTCVCVLCWGPPTGTPRAGPTAHRVPLGMLRVSSPANGAVGARRAKG